MSILKINSKKKHNITQKNSIMQICLNLPLFNLERLELMNSIIVLLKLLFFYIILKINFNLIII
jgi:hypothetical protein